MKKVKNVAKDIILAGIGSLDEQNEEIKDLLRKGSAILGMGSVDNEELIYNGNREEIMKRRLEREREENSVDIGNGRTLYYNASKDEDGKTQRSLELEKKPVNVEKEVQFDMHKSEDGTKTVSINTVKTKSSEGGNENDQN